MRTLKFMAYDDIAKTAYEVKSIDFQQKIITTLFRGHLTNEYHFDELTLHQFTGFKDKHNNEIYEAHEISKNNVIYRVAFDNTRGCFVGNKLNNEVCQKELHFLVTDSFCFNGKYNIN